MLHTFRYIILASIVFVLGCSYGPQPISEVEWISLEEAQEKASIDGKKILVNVYTDWCEFCKKQDTEVYPDSTVKNNMNSYYHSVRLNGESEELITFNGVSMSKVDFARELGVRSYPTILFIDSDGELILQINGYMPVNDFQNMLVYIGEEAYKRTEFHEFVVDR
jgi:thioredoxin-related protein